MCFTDTLKICRRTLNIYVKIFFPNTVTYLAKHSCDHNHAVYFINQTIKIWNYLDVLLIFFYNSEDYLWPVITKYCIYVEVCIYGGMALVITRKIKLFC
jgi:hypothetical protein